MRAIAILACFLQVSTGFVTPSGRNGLLPQQRRDVTKLSTATIDTPTKTSKALENNDHFNWEKTWYPLVSVEMLDPEKPNKFHLLGEDIVVWNDGKVTGEFASKKKRPKNAKRTLGTWRAFVDQCPHRKVPLSEGRVEDDGSLLCSYHAWRFAGDGSCIAIPQIDNESELSRVRSNPKSSCNSYPTKIVDGVLYVWGSTGKDAILESELQPITLNYKLPDGFDPDRLWLGPWNYRELPYSADFFIENVVDGAHVAVSHHNLVGSRYADQTMGVVDVVNPLSKDGFSVITATKLNEKPATTSFKAPGAVHIEIPVGDEGSFQVLELLVSPSRPGFCNHIGRMVIVKDPKGKMPKLLETFTIPMPKFLNHALASLFLHQDALFLHNQERILHQTGKYSSVGSLYSKNVPDSYEQNVNAVRTDKAVVLFRNWLAKFSNGKIPYKQLNPTMPAPDNNAVFDVWNGHTKYCKMCQVAVKRLKMARLASFVVASCFAVLRPFGRIGSLTGTLSFAAAGVLLHKFIGFFYRYEFSHSDNN